MTYNRTELEDAYQAASVEAALRREFYDRMCDAESALAKIREIVLTPSKNTRFAASGRGANDHYASDFDEIRKICDYKTLRA
jgi:hypothetical protein